MKLATIRHGGELRAGLLGDDGRVQLLEAGCVGEVLAVGLDQVRATDEFVDAPEFAPVVPTPSKVVCVGLNYRTHILEMGRELPTVPTLFTKFADTLCGAGDDVWLPPESSSVDWEAELAVIVGAEVRRATPQEAEEAIAGFCIANDVSMRDWQNRTLMWDQGKFWDHSTPLGPWLVTPDELPGALRPDLAIQCEVNGAVVQSSRTSDLVFDPVALVQYVSTAVTLRPGDVLLTGTPGGVGAGRKPPVFLHEGDELVTRIERLGESRVRCVADPTADHR